MDYPSHFYFVIQTGMATASSDSSAIMHIIICLHRIRDKQKGNLSRFRMKLCPHEGMFIMQVLVSQLHCLANKNAQLADYLATLPLFWQVNCIKIGGMLHGCVVLLFIRYTLILATSLITVFTNLINICLLPEFSLGKEI